MNQQNTEKLFNDFPDLYAGKDLPMSQNLMCFGFDHGDGWFDIVYNLSKELSKHEGVKALQVKEKYGELRYYVNFGNDEVWDLIDKATEESLKTCEICGDEGKLIDTTGWLKVRCNKHEEE